MNNFLKIILFSAVLSGIHFFAEKTVFGQSELYYSAISIHGFLLVLTLLTYWVTAKIHSLFPDKTGFAFMAMSLFHIFASVVFLVPLIKSETENKIPATINFFIPFFCYLLIGTYYCTQILNKNTEEKR